MGLRVSGITLMCHEGDQRTHFFGRGPLLTHPVAVVSYESWQKRFGGDAELVGKDVLLNSHQFRVIGIAPEGFKGTEFVYSPEIWLPVSMMEWAEPGATWLEDRSSKNFFAIGRLKSGVNSRQAEASLDLLVQQLGREYPKENEGESIKLTSGVHHPNCAVQW